MLRLFETNLPKPWRLREVILRGEYDVSSKGRMDLAEAEKLVIYGSVVSALFVVAMLLLAATLL